MCLHVMKTKTYYIFSQCSKVNHKSKCRSISKLLDGKIKLFPSNSFDGKIKLLEQNFCEKSDVRINMIDTVLLLSLLFLFFCYHCYYHSHDDCVIVTYYHYLSLSFLKRLTLANKLQK